jgi:hypothetical protein
MKRIVTTLFALSLAGCGPSVDQQSAVKVMGAALNGTNQAQTQLQQSMSGSSATFNGEITNPAGTGSAQVNGSITSSANAFAETFDIAYAHWNDVASGVILDGTLHEDASFSSLNPPIGSAHLNGALIASGTVEATVDFDVTSSYQTGSVQITGNVGGNSINISASN